MRHRLHTSAQKNRICKQILPSTSKTIHFQLIFLMQTGVLKLKSLRKSATSVHLMKTIPLCYINIQFIINSVENTTI
jgi:hypothetical protein